MKKFLLISSLSLCAVLLVVGYAAAATTISTNINTGGTLTVTGASTLTGNVTAAGTLAVTGASTLTGALDLNNKIDVHDQQTGGASNGNIIKKTLQASEDYTGTTAGLMVKNYFADTTPTVSSGEFTGLYVNVKQLAALAGDQSSIISGHNYGTGGDYQALHAGIWLYGDLVNAIKVSNGNSTNGINFSQQTISGSDIVMSNGETISNATDGIIALTGVLTVTGTSSFDGIVINSAGILEQTSDAASDLTAAELSNHVLVFQDAVDDAITLTFGGDILATIIPDGGSVEYIFVNESGGTLTLAADQNATIMTATKTMADNTYARITVTRIGANFWIFMDAVTTMDAGDVT